MGLERTQTNQSTIAAIKTDKSFSSKIHIIGPLLAGLTLATILSARFFIPFVNRATHNTGLILCPFRRMTHLPCPFCGTTRAFAALAEFDLIKAFNLNPLTCLLALAVVVLGFAAPFFFSKTRPLHLSEWVGAYGVKIGMSLILLNWIYLLWSFFTTT